MEGKAADDNIKRVVLEGQVLGVTHDKVEVGTPALLALCLGQCQCCAGQVDADHLTALRSKAQGHVSWTCSNIQHTGRGGRIHRPDQPVDNAGTSYPRAASTRARHEYRDRGEREQCLEYPRQIANETCFEEGRH